MSAMPDNRLPYSPGLSAPTRKRGLFGVPSMIPGMGDMQAPDRMPTMAAEQQPQERKTNWAGVLSDFLGGMVGQPARFAMAQQEQRQIEAQTRARQQLAEAQRAAEMQDWRAKEDYKRANPDAPAPTEIERILSAAGYQPGTPEYTTALRQYANNRVDPVIQTTTTGSDGATYLTGIPASQLRGGTSNLPAPGTVVSDPRKSMSAMQGVPAPQTGASGMPATMTAQQYQAIVQTKGKAWTDQMINRHGIQVTR